ncbi:MAG: aspartate aminotransferase family protein [Chlorobi bacterium]|nr:aspartate aminotransferase family protein [Chlorobiota bacterium]
MQLTNRQLFRQNLAVPADIPEAIEIESAEGIFLTSVDGQKYIDLVSGVSVSNVGHRHPAVVKAIKEQLDKYMHLMVYGKYIQSPQVRLAGLLSSVLPEKLDSVFLVNSGSEAIEGALKLAKRISGRSEIMAFKKSYHGSTHGALSILGDERMKSAYRPLLPNVKLLEYNNLDDLDKINADTASVVVEAIQAEAGIIIPSQDFMHKLNVKCHENKCLLIVDEVQMGFGRTGKMFGFEHFDIEPDIVCFAKGLGGGMPIGAFVSSKENMNLLTFNPALGHITTFGGHPVSSASALASLKLILDEGLHKKSNDKGLLIASGLEKHPKIKTIRRIGLMLGVELKSDFSAARMVKILQGHHLIVDQFLFNESSFRIAPPLTITEDEIRVVIEMLNACLDDL